MAQKYLMQHAFGLDLDAALSKVRFDIGNGSHEGTENNLGVVLENLGVVLVWSWCGLQQNKTNFKIN
jgi:hypothetical protein